MPDHVRLKPLQGLCDVGAPSVAIKLSYDGTTLDVYVIPRAWKDEPNAVIGLKAGTILSVRGDPPRDYYQSSEAFRFRWFFPHAFHITDFEMDDPFPDAAFPAIDDEAERKEFYKTYIYVLVNSPWLKSQRPYDGVSRSLTHYRIRCEDEGTIDVLGDEVEGQWTANPYLPLAEESAAP